MREEFEIPVSSPDAYEKRCYTVEEVMDILATSRKSVYELIGQQLFRTVRVGGKYRISKRSFDKWLDEIS